MPVHTVLCLCTHNLWHRNTEHKTARNPWHPTGLGRVWLFSEIAHSSPFILLCFGGGTVPTHAFLRKQHSTCTSFQENDEAPAVLFLLLGLEGHRTCTHRICATEAQKSKSSQEDPKSHTIVSQSILGELVLLKLSTESFSLLGFGGHHSNALHLHMHG